jgi:membrane protein involved in colicin uptake
LQDAAKARIERDQREVQRKQAADKIEPANKQLADAEEAAKKAETARGVADTELTLAKAEAEKNANCGERREGCRGCRRSGAEKR